MDRHTPGPWEVGGPYPGVSVIVLKDAGSSGPDPEPPCYDPICILDSRTTGEPHPQTLADARLIAAAPDLLDAVKRLIPFFEPIHEEAQQALKAAEAAIAKAEGREVRS